MIAPGDCADSSNARVRPATRLPWSWHGGRRFRGSARCGRAPWCSRPAQDCGVPIRSLSSRRILAAFEQLDRSARHDGRDRVLVDKLRMTVAPQQQAEIVEPGDYSLQLHSIDQKDRQWRLGFANVIKEGVL